MNWLLRPPADDVRARVFCLPYSGVGASMYAGWPERIGPVGFCPVQPPGRENRLRDAHYGTFDTLAESLIADLGHLMDRPFAFFGHCSSALAGYVVNRRLGDLGRMTASRLFVSSQVSPDVGPYGRFLRMTDDELRAAIRTLVRAAGGEPHDAFVEIGLGVMKADISAHKRYPAIGPTESSTGITVIGWDRDTEIPPELMDGWRAYSDDVRFVTLTGTHHTFLTAPLALIAEIAADMTAYVTEPRP